jgi:hypothetical protein
MSHHDNDEIVGLTGALQKLPAMFRAIARQEFRRAFFEAGYANFGEPEIIHYKSRTGRTLNKALLLNVECENFIFDLFFVSDRQHRFVPVVGRVYFLPTNHAGLIN